MVHQKGRKIHDGSFQATGSGSTYTVDRNLTIIASGPDAKGGEHGAVYEDQTATAAVHDNTFDINGRLIGYAYGLQTYGDHDRINIGVDGKVSGGYAVVAEGEGAIVANRGTIVSSRNIAVAEIGENSRFHNFGTVVGFTGVADSTENGIGVVNEANGRIFGFNQGVYLGFGGAHLVNHGLIHSSQLAIDADSGDDFIVNDGLLEGAVDLGAGDDVLDTRGGRIHGIISGDIGDDLLITDNARYKLLEGVDGGADTVESSVSYKLSINVETLILIGKGDINGTGTSGGDTLIGNDGDNTLVGNAGPDILAGGKGDDTLIGRNPNSIDLSDGDDRFVFSTGDGHDRVMDYVEFDDSLDLTNWKGIESRADVIAHAHDTQDGVLIKLGHDSLLVATLDKIDLSDDGVEFMF